MSALDLPLEINQWALAEWVEAATAPLLPIAMGAEIHALVDDEELGLAA